MDFQSVYRPNNLIYTQENLSRYCPGGYHPVSLADTFNHGRYEIHHRLGWGGFSTVWLADDREKNQWVSVKIMTADSSQESRELRILRQLEKCSQENLSLKYIVQLLDTFTHAGPNGIHQCLVFELLGPSVDRVLGDYYNSQDTLETENTLRLSEQLLEAIKFIHDAGMGHGDISGANVAFSCSHLWNAAKGDLFDVLGMPESEELARLDGKPLGKNLPKHIVKATEWDDWIGEDDEDLRILDLGEGFLQGDEPSALAQPGPLRVPEIIFEERFDHRIDLWRAGCMIYLFISGTYPFQYLGDDDVLVAQMIGLLEELPQKWRPQWEHMRLNSKRKLKMKRSCLLSKLEGRANEGEHNPSLARLVLIIQGLMRFLPSSRMKVSEALDLLRLGQCLESCHE